MGRGDLILVEESAKLQKLPTARFRIHGCENLALRDSTLRGENTGFQLLPDFAFHNAKFRIPCCEVLKHNATLLQVIFWIKREASKRPPSDGTAYFRIL